MQAGGAGSDDGDVGALKAELHRHMSGNHVDDGAGYKKWRDAPGPPGNQFNLGFFNQRQAANARTDDATYAHGLVFGQQIAYRQTAVSHGLTSCCHAVMDEGVHVPAFFFSDVVADLKGIDFTRYLAGESAGIKLGNQPDA